MSAVTTYEATLGEHRVTLEFDQRLVVMNRARLRVDGSEVDRTRVVYGERELSATAEDGTEVVVRLHSGMVGEIDRPQLRGADGAWIDMREV